MPSRSLVAASVLSATAFACAVAGPVATADDGAGAPTARTPRGDRSLARLVPAFFEANRGQAPAGWDFVVRCRGYNVFVRSGEAVFSFEGRGLAMSLEGACPVTPDVGGLALAARANYLIGNVPEKWIRGVPLARGAVYRDAAPGTTWTVGTKDRLFDFALEVPGTDEPRFRLAGSDELRIGDDGALRVAMPGGQATFTAPLAWQMDGSARRAVDARFELDGDGLVRVALGRRDPSRRTIVDPTVSWCSYLGGKDEENLARAAADPSGGIYVLGQTKSPDFPATTGAYSTTKQTDGTATVRSDVFVAKLASSGTSLAWATYFGGSSDDSVADAAADASGNVVFGGASAGTDLPTTAGVMIQYYVTNAGGFVAKLNSTGDALVFSTYAGAQVNSLALGPNGNAYFQDGASVRKLASDATSLVWATRITPTSTIGGEWTNLYQVAVDRFDRACVVGESSQSNMGYTSGTYQTSVKGQQDAFVAKLDSAGAVAWKTLVGGSRREIAFCVDMDLVGRPAIAGFTASADFPVTSDAHQSSRQGAGQDDQDAFLARLDPDGKTLMYSTYFGGAAGADAFTHVRYHPTGVIYVAGRAGGSDFPLVNAFDSTYGTSAECVLLKWDRHYSLAWSSFVGGSAFDYTGGLAMGPDGTITLSGITYSSDLPVSSAYQSSPASTADGFFLTVPDTLPTSVPLPSITSAALHDWTVDRPFDETPATSGGTAPLTWTLRSGTLPTGLSLADDGSVSGTPTETGIYTFTLRVEDDYEITADRELTLRINPPPTVATSSLPDWTAGVPFQRDLAVTTGTGAGDFAWSVVSGSLPPGLELSAGGRIEGSATQAVFRSFTVQVTDAAGASATRALTMKVNAALAVEDRDPPPWTEHRPFEFTFGSTGGTGDLRWVVADGALPVANGLAAQTGVLVGPTLAAGDYEFTVQVTDSVGGVGTRNCRAVVRPTPSVATAELPPAAAGRPYAATLAAADGTGPFRWAVAEGALPAGLVLDELTGRVSGTPTAARSGPVEFTCTDRAGAAASGDVILRSAGVTPLAKKRAAGSLRLKSGVAGSTTRFLEVTEGCLLDVAVTGGGAKGVGPTLRLLAPDGAAVELGARLRTTPRGATLRRFAVPATGRWFVAIDAAPGSKGTLRFTVSISPPKSWVATLAADAAAAAPAEMRFAAPPGAKVTVRLAPPAAGPARPVLVDLLGPDGASLLAGGSPSTKGPTVTFVPRTKLLGGDHRVLVSAEEGSPGDVVCTVKLVLPKRYGFALPELPAGDDE